MGKVSVSDEVLADVLIDRINQLIKDDSVRKALGDLCLKGKVTVTGSVVDHPSIQILSKGDEFVLGFLGMLNGIVGSIDGGPLDRCGYIAAVYDKPSEDAEVEDFELLHFKRFDRE